MTAYLLTEAQHAQIVDALEWPTPGVAAQVQRNLALAMLKAMKPASPVGEVVRGLGPALYKIGDRSNFGMKLYALGDTA